MASKVKRQKRRTPKNPTPRQDATTAKEEQLYAAGQTWVAGVDEVGLGCCAGPVVACACMFDATKLPQLNKRVAGVRDSKQLSELAREKLYAQLKACDGVHYAIGIISPSRVDEINVLQASWEAMAQAVDQLSVRPDVILVDGNKRPKPLVERGFQVETLVKGDVTCYAIAAASIMAKVTRDRLMKQYDLEYPVYGFASHNGYPSPQHRAALKEHGPCAIHRKKYKTVTKALEMRRKQIKEAEEKKKTENCA